MVCIIQFIAHFEDWSHGRTNHSVGGIPKNHFWRVVSLLYGVPENLLRKVQSVQNAAARLLTSARRCDHITPLLRQYGCQSRDEWSSRSRVLYTSR